MGVGWLGNTSYHDQNIIRLQIKKEKWVNRRCSLISHYPLDSSSHFKQVGPSYLQETEEKSESTEYSPRAHWSFLLCWHHLLILLMFDPAFSLEKNCLLIINSEFFTRLFQECDYNIYRSKRLAQLDTQSA